jgi:putative Ca2+/H+ antiporter (TMEM165/GDT1 family)
MEWKLFLTVFSTVFLAELGDKTQVATFLYAADARNPRAFVFLASALALVVSSALAVALGSYLAEHVPYRAVSWLAGIAFIGVGIWTILRA